MFTIAWPGIEFEEPNGELANKTLSYAVVSFHLICLHEHRKHFEWSIVNAIFFSFPCDLLNCRKILTSILTQKKLQEIVGNRGFASFLYILIPTTFVVDAM
jgi:hypothetical protein